MKMFRLLSLLLSLALLSSTLTFSGAKASILKTYDMEQTARVASAFEKFNYAMNVLWDQKDPDFKARAQKELAHALHGVDSELLESYAMNSLGDAKAREEFSRMVEAMKAQNLSIKEVVTKTQEWVNKGAVGLSFAGNGGYQCGKVCKIVTVIILIVVIKQIFNHDHDNGNDVPVEEEHECPDYEYPYPEYY